MLEQIRDASQVEWILRSLNENGTRVSNLLPHGYDAYCKILHPIYESIDDEPVSSKEVVTLLKSREPFPKDRFRRLSWSTLFKRYNLVWTPEISNYSFNQWPKNVMAPYEGWLEQDLAIALVQLLAAATGTQDCYFYYDVLRTVFFDQKELLFKGKLADVLALNGGDIELKSVGPSPAYWWPEDKSWCLNTDWDLHFTLLAGNRDLVDNILASTALESVEVDLATRVDYHADVVNRQ